MEFKTTSYHRNLIRDTERVAVFNEAIKDYALKFNLTNSNNSNNSNFSNSNSNKFNPQDTLESNLVAFDLGCGSGILSYLAKDYFDKIISIDINHKVVPLTKENLADFDNIEVYCDDVIGFDFKDKADLIICEMLDTALIDEEEVPVLNYAKNFLKENGVIIPQSIINSVEPIYMQNHYIQYEDVDSNPIYDVLGDSVIYSEFNFLEDIDEDFKCQFEFNTFYNSSKSNFNSQDNDLNLNDDDLIKVNGIKITSFTKLNDDVIVGPTPMLNPCLLVPIDEIELNCQDSLKIELSYTMGGGIETIKTKIL